MNRGSFRVGNQDTPHSVRRELRAAYRSDAQRGWNPHNQEPSASVVLKPSCRCGSGEGVRLRSGVFCRRCGRAVAIPSGKGAPRHI